MELKEMEGKEGREREEMDGRRSKEERMERRREEIWIIIIKRKGLRKTLTHSIK